jgi:predicted nucleotidyltransferase
VHSPTPAEQSVAVRCARAWLARAREEQEAARVAALETRGRAQRLVRAVPPELRPTRAALFGSLVWGGFDPERSDVDVVVWGLDASAAEELTERLWAAMGRPVHLVRAEVAPVSLLRRVERDGEVLDVA